MNVNKESVEFGETEQGLSPLGKVWLIGMLEFS